MGSPLILLLVLLGMTLSCLGFYAALKQIRRKKKQAAQNKKASRDKLDIYGYESTYVRSRIGQILLKLRYCNNILTAKHFMLIRIKPVMLNENDVHLDIESERFGMTDQMAQEVLSGMYKHCVESHRHEAEVDGMIESLKNNPEQKK